MLAAGAVVVAGLGMAACSGKSTSASNSSVPATTATTAVGAVPTTPAAAAAGSNSNAAIDQQIQGLNSSINQVSGDLSSADKAAANGG
jgi:hypothetical protein